MDSSRTLAWPSRPQAARLLAALADPGRGFDAVVVGSHERAFYGNQFSLMAPVFEHYGVQLWSPEVGGRLDPSVTCLEELAVLLGTVSKRAVVRARARTMGSMAVQVGEQGRFMGGRPPYGMRLVPSRPHPNWDLARRGVRLQVLDADPVTGPVVVWIFRMRREGFSVARIARALNDAGIPCPSAADPLRNPHRTAAGWAVGAVRVILANPVYTGRSVWNRQRTERVLIDPDNPGLGHREVMRWNTPDKWIIFSKPTHPGLISEDEFIAVQDMCAARADARHGYLLTGLLRCAGCGRGMQATSTHGNAAYRCRHGHTSADTPDPVPSKNAYVRESHILARLPLLHLLLTADPSPLEGRPKTSATTKATSARPEEVIDYLRERALVLAYDPETRTLEADGERTARVTV